jgi:hypothetical protein
MYTKHIHRIYPLCLPFPSHWYPPWDRTCFTFLSIVFKYMLIIQGSFTMVSQACIYHMLIRLAPITHTSIALVPYYSATFSMFCYTIFIHRYNVFFLYYSLSHSLFFSLPLSPSFLQADPLLQSCSLSLYVCVWPYMIIYVFMYMFIF